MTSETNPESSTTSYTFDSDSTCGTSNGDLVKSVDAVGNITCHAYDALHRATSTTYSGPYSSVTPSRYLVYDSATVNSVVMTNAKAHLAEAYTCVSPCSSKLTDEGFSYTARGETSDVYESTPHFGGYYHLTETYWANGALDQLSGLSGLPTITYGVDGEGRTYTASASSGQNPLSSTSYSTASLPTQITLGSSDADSYAYDPNTNRMTQYKFTVNSQSVTGNLTWNANGSLASLLVTDPFNSSDTQSCSFSHDDLARIASANCGSTWSQTFSYYDAFGNIEKTGSSSFQATYSYLTNRMTQIGSSNPTYDANGNVTNDFLNTYSWDANGRPVTIDSVNVTYDALGRMVEENKSGTYTEIVYDPLGNKLALMTGQSLSKAYVPLPAGDVAAYNASGLSNYDHVDWLGSFRLASSSTRTVVFDTAYGPFGERYATTGSGVAAFTGQTQDTASTVYDFPAREYGIQGRWPSPDPAGIAAVDPTDPQTWNRYSYVRNSPLTLMDPTGYDDVGPIPLPSNPPSITVYGSAPDNGLISIPESDDPEWCNPVVLIGCLLPPGTQPSGPPPGVGGAGGGGGGATLTGKIGKALKKAVCSALPQGRTENLNGSLGLLGGQTGSLSVVINYQSGQVSGFATGGLQVGWNGAAATSVSTGFIYGNLGSNNGGYSGPFVSGYGSGPVFGGYASFSNGVSVYGASMGANLTGGAGGGANFTETTAPHQFGPVVGSLFKTPLDNILSLAKGLACHQ